MLNNFIIRQKEGGVKWGNGEKPGNGDNLRCVFSGLCIVLQNIKIRILFGS